MTGTRTPSSESDPASDGSTYFLRTERIGFRLWTAADIPLAVGLWGDTQVTRLIADLGQPSEEQARERLVREIANWTDHGVQYWPIFLLDSGDHVGCCGLRPYQAEELVYEIGAHLNSKYWGKGYATEALQGVMAHAFGPLKLRGLFARHNPNNDGSRRLMANLGFRYTHDEWLPQTRLYHPSYLLLAKEYPGLHEAPRYTDASGKPTHRVVIHADGSASAKVH